MALPQQIQIPQDIKNIWCTILSLADKEFAMSMVEPIEVAIDEQDVIKLKINEIINIFK